MKTFKLNMVTALLITSGMLMRPVVLALSSPQKTEDGEIEKIVVRGDSTSLIQPFNQKRFFRYRDRANFSC